MAYPYSAMQGADPLRPVGQGDTGDPYSRWFQRAAAYGGSSALGMQGTGRAGSGEEQTPGVTKNPGESHVKQPGRKSSPAECETCKERKYQDGSNENDVSFKSPGHISPEAAPGAVRAHEQEHVANAYEKAQKGGGKVLQASVRIKTAVCPECGRTYVSGGETSTKIAYPADKEAEARQSRAGGIGQRFDRTA